MSGLWPNNGKPEQTGTKAPNKSPAKPPLAGFFPKLRWSILDSLKRFFLLQGLSHAAALAFYALLSLLPLILLMLIISGRLWGNSAEVQHFIDEQMHQLAPWAESYLLLVLQNPGAHLVSLGWISFAFIIWTSGLFFNQLQNSLILPWTERRLYRKRLWRFFIPWTIGPALAIISGGVMLLMNVAAYLPTEWLPAAVKPKFFSFLISGILIIIMYSLLLPARRTPFCVTVILSALIAGAELALSTIFAMLVVKNPQYTVVYGSLAALILFMLWVYYSMSILVFGGYFLESWSFVQGRKKRRPRNNPTTPPQT